MIFLFLYAAPYWGSLYFNGCGYSIFGALAFVSVPYWGSLYFNFTMIVPLLLITSFRPLLGFFIFQLWSWKCKCCCVKCFRPLLGFFIFQWKEPKTSAMPWFLFPSPIGVLYISIRKELIGGKKDERGFRPLLGFFIFQ